MSMTEAYFASTIGDQAAGVGGTQYATFDGVDDYMIIPTIEASFSQGFTIEGWFRFAASITPFSYIYEFNSSIEEAYIRLITIDDNPEKEGFLQISRLDGGGIGRGMDNYLLTGWHYYAITFKYIEGNSFGNDVLFYRDDVLLDTVGLNSMGIKDVTRNNNKLGRGNSVSNRVGMDVRNLKVWNIERSASELELRGEGVSPNPNLILDYPFQGDLLDYSGNNLHGTDSGGITFNSEP